MVLSRVPVLAVVGLLALVVAAGCTDSTGGVATPGDDDTESTTGGPSSPPSSGAEPTVEIPQRPRDLSLDGIQPCSLFTQAQLTQLREQLQIDRPPESRTTGDRFEAPACELEQSREPFDSYTVMLVTSEGIEFWLSEDRNVDSWLVDVGGYPAAQYKLAGSEDAECVTAVGVADEQMLVIDFIPIQRENYQVLCQKTEQVAAMALQTLQTLR